MEWDTAAGHAIAVSYTHLKLLTTKVVKIIKNKSDSVNIIDVYKRQVLHVFFPFRCEGFTTKGLEKKKHIAELCV